VLENWVPPVLQHLLDTRTFNADARDLYQLVIEKGVTLFAVLCNSHNRASA